MAAMAILEMGILVLTHSMPDIIDVQKPPNHDLIIRDPVTQTEYIIKFTRTQSGNYEATIKHDPKILQILKEYQWYVRRA